MSRQSRTHYAVGFYRIEPPRHGEARREDARLPALQPDFLFVVDRRADLQLLQKIRNHEVRIMNMNVISLRTREPVPEPMLVSTYSLLIGGEIYRVRRAVERDTKCGFVTIHDSCGKPVLVFSASFPDAHIGQLIVAWRTGNRQGLERGRRESSPENVS